MDKSTQALKQGDVIYFESNESLQSCFISEIIRVLNYYKIPKPIRFSYVPPSGLLLKELTLKENILLESIPTSLCISHSKEFQLKNYLQKTGNIHLIRIFNLISDYLEKKVEEIPEEITKLGLFVKVIIKEAPILILDDPEKHLSPGSFRLVESTIKHHIAEKPSMLIINSPNNQLFAPYINKILSKQTNEYKIKTIQQSVLRKSNEYSLIENSDEGVLIFKNLPEEIKKTA
jgi:hypothetical protein